jgi:hypothetical protein
LHKKVALKDNFTFCLAECIYFHTFIHATILFFK